MADAVSAALEGAAAELRAWRESLLASCVKWLVGAFGGREPGPDGARGQEAQMLLRFNQLLVGALPFLSVPVGFQGQEGRPGVTAHTTPGMNGAGEGEGPCLGGQVAGATPDVRSRRGRWTSAGTWCIF